MNWWRRGNPADRRHREELEEARRTTRWTRRGTLITAVALIVSVAGVAAAWLQLRPSHSGPRGTLVVVQTADIGGVSIVAVAGGVRPVDYLRDGTRLYIDCLQLVGPNHDQASPYYVQARISYGAFQSRWIDALTLRDTRNTDVRRLKPPLPFCGPTVPLDTSVPGE